MTSTQFLALPPVAWPASRQAAKRWLLACVLVALVGAQALGFMHRVVHAPADLGHAHAAWAGGHEQHGDQARGEHTHAANWVNDLFAAHDDPSGCRLYDGVGQDSVSLPAVPALPCHGPAATVLPFLAGEFLARWAALYDARGPPLSR